MYKLAENSENSAINFILSMEASEVLKWIMMQKNKTNK